MAISKCFKKSESLKDNIFKLLFSSLRFIQWRACVCGSMHKGKREALIVRIPFWTDNSSGGNPSEFHLKVGSFKFNGTIIEQVYISLTVSWNAIVSL